MINAKTYRAYKKRLATYNAWAEQFRNKSGWTVIPAGSKPPVKVDNAMRSAVEIYELNHNQPAAFTAYIGNAMGNGMGVDGIRSQSFTVTTWTGEKICYATRGATWRVNSFVGDTMSQFYCRLNGREYTGRGFGQGMCITFRETAESKRRVAA